MSHSELNQLTRAEELFAEGELERALEILNDWRQFEGLNPQQKRYYQFIKGMILTHQHKHEELIKWGEKIFEEAKEENNNLQSFDGLYFIISGFCLAEKFDDASKLIDKAEASFNLISNTSKSILIQREVRLNILKAWINFELTNIDLAEQGLELVFDVKKNLGNSFEIVWAYTLKGQIMFFIKRNTEISLNYFKKALSIAKEIKFNHYWIMICHGFSAIIYGSIGDLDNCLKHYTKAFEIIKGFKSTFLNAAYLNNIGFIYCEKGEYDLALKTLKESLLLSEKNQSIPIETPLNSLIDVALRKGDIELAQKYFHRLENLYNQKKDSHIELIYYYSKALILKRSSRIRDKVKAEELFKNVLDTKTLSLDVIINSYIHLCDLHLSEYQISNNSEVLNDINQNITQLLAIAEKSHSYLVFCETFILQAKLALINFEMKAARRYLTKAQKIAEKYGLTLLAKKISREHDELLKQLDLWEKLKELNIPLSERWKLAGMNKQMEQILEKRTIDVPELSEEQPVCLLIITEGGMPLFSQSFVEEKSFESHLFGGFLTSIDYFVKEMFSEGLDRAIFGEYTLLMKSIPPFFISYIFKGDSYYALQKLKYFLENAQREDVIWQNLLKFFQANQSIHLKDIPLLESLITETFINKNTSFNRI